MTTRSILILATLLTAACGAAEGTSPLVDHADDDAGALALHDAGKPAVPHDPLPGHADASAREAGTRVDAGARADSGGGSAPCDGAGVDLALTESAHVLARPLAFAGAPLAPPFVSPDTCPVSATVHDTVRPYVALVVQNASSGSATLSAWAVCDASGDAFLAFYRADAPPSTESERRACAVGTILSNGDSFTLGDHSSPDSNGSRYCPSLLAERNVGLRLARCEKAILVVQPWEDPESTTKTPPSAIKVRLD